MLGSDLENGDDLLTVRVEGDRPSGKAIVTSDAEYRFCNDRYRFNSKTSTNLLVCCIVYEKTTLRK
ncbi:MAG: hypothetical protein R6V47_04885 [Candidatus Delongbacteria bacterium]